MTTALDVIEMESPVFHHYPAGFSRTVIELPTGTRGAHLPAPFTPVPIWFVGSGSQRRKLTRPLAFRLSYDEGLYFAENETLAINAHGTSAHAAVIDAMEQVLYFYDYYGKLNDEDVIGPAVKLRKIYSTLLKDSSYAA